MLFAPLALSACGPSAGSRLVITQSTDAPSGADHKGHLSPGAFTGITLSIRNTGAGPARGVTVEDILPAGFHYYELTTLGGNAIRTATSEPAAQGNPSWGTWTIPAENGNTVSALVISFKVQVALNPGDYKNQVKLTTSTVTEIDPGDPVALVIEPRPSLTLTAAAATGQVTTGSLATYIISVANVGSAVARGVAVSVSLAPGFLYSATTGYEGNSIRVTAVDPPASSLLPLWSSWDIPGASNGAPGLLRLTFQARILAGVVPGLYNLTAAVTSTRDVPAQTIGNTAPVAVGKGSRVPITMTVAPTVTILTRSRASRAAARGAAPSTASMTTTSGRHDSICSRSSSGDAAPPTSSQFVDTVARFSSTRRSRPGAAHRTSKARHI